MNAALFDYALRLGDSSLILGQRVSEWCGHAPEMELDLALANIGLDLIGQARLFLTYAGEIEGQGRDEDALAFTRDVLQFRNLLLVEQDNGDFAHTIARQYLFSQWQQLLFTSLAHSQDQRLADIAAKSLKEIAYHLQFSRDWVIRLGDGTDESHQRITTALDWLWRYVDDMFDSDAAEQPLIATGIAVDASAQRSAWDAAVDATLAEACLTRPALRRGVIGARRGHHTEALGHLLAGMQYLQRAYPGARW